MKNVYSNTKKSNGRTFFADLKRQWAVEDAAVQDLADRSCMSGSYANGIAIWAVVLGHLLRADDARRGEAPSYRYRFGDEDRLRLVRWQTRYLADEHDRGEAERLLVPLLEQAVPLDSLVKAVFDALEFAARPERSAA